MGSAGPCHRPPSLRAPCRTRRDRSTPPSHSETSSVCVPWMAELGSPLLWLRLWLPGDGRGHGARGPPPWWSVVSGAGAPCFCRVFAEHFPLTKAPQCWTVSSPGARGCSVGLCLTEEWPARLGHLHSHLEERSPMLGLLALVALWSTQGETGPCSVRCPGPQRAGESWRRWAAQAGGASLAKHCARRCGGVVTWVTSEAVSLALQILFHPLWSLGMRLPLCSDVGLSAGLCVGDLPLPGGPGSWTG